MTRPLPTLPAIVFLLAASGLTACGDGAEDAVPRDEPAAVAPPAADEQAAVGGETATMDETTASAPIADVLGTFEGVVAGLALWEHPTTPYLGSVVAANGAAGLSLIPLDPETAPRTIPGTFDGGVGVGYLSDGRSVIAAASGDEILLFEAAADRTLSPLGRFPAGGPSAAVCVVGARVLSVAPAPRALPRAEPLDLGGGVRAELATGVGEACASDGERLYTLRAGTVFAEAPGVRTAERLDMTVPEGADGLAALRGRAGTALVFTRGGRLVAEGTTVTLTREGVAEDAAVARLAAGSGNYGGVYRDGVVAVLDDQARLLALPWSGLARAADLPVATTSLRPPEAAAAAGAITPSLPELSLPATSAPAPE